jgi:hypothetical protein
VRSVNSSVIGRSTATATAAVRPGANPEQMRLKAKVTEQKAQLVRLRAEVRAQLN